MELDRGWGVYIFCVRWNRNSIMGVWQHLSFQLRETFMADRIWGYPVRSQLYSGEDSYFRQNRHVTGMAADDGHIILNPYSMLPQAQRESVLRNEAARLYMREKQFKYDFDITPEQRSAFRGTPYANDDYALSATILARALSGDPSAGTLNQRQKEWVEWLLPQLNNRR